MSLGMLGQLNTKAGCLRIDVILVEYMHELVAEVQILFQMLSWVFSGMVVLTSPEIIFVWRDESIRVCMS